jgi:hypothetical protein
MGSLLDRPPSKNLEKKQNRVRAFVSVHYCVRMIILHSSSPITEYFLILLPQYFLSRIDNFPGDVKYAFSVAIVA